MADWGFREIRRIGEDSLSRLALCKHESARQVALLVEWSKAHVLCVLPPGCQGFEPWFQLELESDRKLPRRDFPFKASSGCK
ncbi:MAG: hypothetical protein GY696_25180 [Gammaproteobacteria bacterium]|nr:hypothetical protein [Gammaproteobacteria bacterium]